MEAINLSSLIEEIEKISQVEKCLTCQCFYDTLVEFKEVMEKEKTDGGLNARLSNLIEKAKVGHDCLGCEPCLPVPVSNRLAEMLGGVPTCSCGHVCRPAWVKLMGLKPSWPVEQGEYIIGEQTAPVAISTLGSDDLPGLLAEKLGKAGFAIIGKTHTENIGIEKIIKNTITNPNIRFLVLCGKDTKGHMAGQSLVSLINNGVTEGKKIINSKGQRPVLKNLEFAEIEHFRTQVELVNHIGSEDLIVLEDKIGECVKRNPGRFDRSLAIKQVPKIEARQAEKLVLDPSGFFIIYPKKEEGTIYLEHYSADGALNEVIYGNDPVSIASTAIERRLVSRLDHAAYLGRELEKAYLSMCYGFQYIQDSAPGK